MIFLLYQIFKFNQVLFVYILYVKITIQNQYFPQIDRHLDLTLLQKLFPLNYLLYPLVLLSLIYSDSSTNTA